METGSGLDDYLSFWTFDGTEDGEDIKMKFKQRFSGVDAILTEAEKDEVVAESSYIMHTMLGLVDEIARAVGDSKQNESLEMEDLSMIQLLLKHTLPMGLVELLSAATNALKASKGVLGLATV